MEIWIGKRKIPLYYSTLEMMDIQEAVGCTAFELREKVFGIVARDEDEEDGEPKVEITVAKDPEKIRKMAAVIRILGNAGLEENGQEPDLTEKWILRHMAPAAIVPYAISVMAQIVEGNQMEAKEENRGPVDLILEEEEAKKQPGN